MGGLSFGAAAGGTDWMEALGVLHVDLDQSWWSLMNPRSWT